MLPPVFIRAVFVRFSFKSVGWFVMDPCQDLWPVTWKNEEGFPVYQINVMTCAKYWTPASTVSEQTLMGVSVAVVNLFPNHRQLSAAD